MPNRDRRSSVGRFIKAKGDRRCALTASRSQKAMCLDSLMSALLLVSPKPLHVRACVCERIVCVCTYVLMCMYAMLHLRGVSEGGTCPEQEAHERPARVQHSTPVAVLEWYKFQIAESKEQRAKSKEQRAESREQRAEGRE
jgi:hypothetical protein